MNKLEPAESESEESDSEESVEPAGHVIFIDVDQLDLAMLTLLETPE